MNGSIGRTDTDQKKWIGTMREDVMTMGTIATTNVGKATIEIDMNVTSYAYVTNQYERDYSLDYDRRRDAL